LSQLIPVGSEVYILEENDMDVLALMYKEEAKESEVPLSEDEFFEDMFNSQNVGDSENYLNVIVKSSSQGSLQALEKSLSKLEKDGYKVKIVFSGVGDINFADIELAKLSKSILLGFEVNIQKGAEDVASKEGVLLRTYTVIYKLIEEVEDALEMISSPDEAEEEIGYANIRMIISLSDGSKVLGCRVKEGILKRDCKVYVVRNDEIIGEGIIKSLRINKNVVTEVKQGEECGAILNVDVQAQEGDELYCYRSSR
jgi:translation initiation factor IF-2